MLEEQEDKAEKAVLEAPWGWVLTGVCLPHRVGGQQRGPLLLKIKFDLNFAKKRLVLIFKFDAGAFLKRGRKRWSEENAMCLVDAKYEKEYAD